MPVSGFVALALGVAVLLIAAFATTEPDLQGDDAAVWEGRVALGFGVVLTAGPLWLLQAVLTLAATALDDGSPWLWAWWAGAPLLAFTPPVLAITRLRARARERARRRA